MRVDAKFKKQILAGKRPALTDPKVKRGDVIEIERDRVWLEVMHQKKAGVWAYHLTDFRGRFMARQQGRQHPQQYVDSAHDAIDEAEAVEVEDQKRITKDAERRWEMYMRERGLA